MTTTRTHNRLSERDRARVGEDNLARIGAEAIATSRSVRALTAADDFDSPLTDTDLLSALRNSEMGRELALEKQAEREAAEQIAAEYRAAQIADATTVVEELFQDFTARRDALIHALVELAKESERLRGIRGRMEAAQRIARKVGAELTIPERLNIEAQRASNFGLRGKLAVIRATDLNL